MSKSRDGQLDFVRLSIFIMFLSFGGTNLSAAGLRPCVEVTIEAEHHVWPAHTMKDYIFLPLKLTYRIPPTQDGRLITINTAPGVAGLVVQHTACNGTRTTQSIEPEAWWLSKGEKLQVESSTLPTYFSIWVLPGTDFNFSELGIYRISYVHPWAASEEDPNSPVFQSSTLTIACVTQDRYDQLHMMLRQNLDLAVASYKFKNPPSSTEFPKYRRADCSLKKIDDFIKEGIKQDEVLLLLGSPDAIYYSKSSEGRRWDQEWFYETSPAGGYYVMFKRDYVVDKGEHGDWNGVTAYDR